MNQFVIGLAGHIDHGKTSLVHVLTGTDTDRLEEEIRRGMTIDLGFAFLNNQITLIDVPGHEKFIKNMMAGACGIDAGLLVIAADDGIMPQTREHLDILSIIGIKHIIIALNKIDLVEDDWIEMVKIDILELLSDLSISDFEIISVSAIRNSGINKLKQALINMSKKRNLRNDRGIFRLPIDRVFTKHGFGTVITGTVESGILKKGDEIEILPIGKHVKVRGLQSHDEQVESVSMGDRAAINLQSLSKSYVQRGHQLTSIGYFKPTDQFGAYFTLMKNAKHNLKQNQRVRIHLGTMEVMARICLLNSNVLSPGKSAPIIISLESPLVAAIYDKFIVRHYSPVITIGGGSVVDAHLNGSWKEKKKLILSICSEKSDSRLLKIISTQLFNPLDKKSIGIKFGKSEELLINEIKNIKEIKILENNVHKWLVNKKNLEKCKIKIQEMLDHFQKSNPYRSGVIQKEIYQFTNGNSIYIDYLLELMEQEKLIGRTGEFWHTYGYKISLDNKQQKIYSIIIEKLDKEKFASSSIEDLAQFVNQSMEMTKNLIKVAESRGELICLTGFILFTKNNFNLLKKNVIKFLEQNECMTVSQFKDISGTTRKFAVPLLEYFDKNRITIRDGNKRRLFS